MRQPDADFSFITNPVKPTPKVQLLAGGSKMQRILLALGGLTMLVIIIAIAASVIGGGGPDRLALMTSVAQQQTELNRVATLGANKATTSAVRGAARSIQLTSLSARSQVSSYLVTNKEQLNPKLLPLKRDAKTDTALSDAAANNTYNATFADVITTDLDSYMSSLKAAYDAKPGPKGQALLKSQYDDAQLMAKQIKNAAALTDD